MPSTLDSTSMSVVLVHGGFVDGSGWEGVYRMWFLWTAHKDWYQPPGERACLHIGADYAGVDLVRDSEGRLQVLEVNGIPAWRGLQSVTPIDIADRVAEDFLSRRVGAGSVVNA